MLKSCSKLLTRKPKIVILIATLLLIPSIMGAAITKVNYDILSYLPEKEESVIGETVLEETFKSAATTFLIIDHMPDRDVKILKEKIEGIEAVNEVVSIRDMVGVGVPKEFLPKKLTDNFYSESGQMLIIKYDEKAASESTMKAIDEINKLITKESYLSGLSVLLKDIKALILSEMPKYIVFAALLSWLALTLCIDSWMLPLIFLLTIFYGVVYNFGTNVFKGEISYITQAIAGILQLAVTTDYAIFVVHRYDEEKPKFEDKRDAMAAAVQQAFVSLAGSSLTTIAGFAALCFMGFTLGMDLGIVMIKGVVLGVISCVTILPSFILLFDSPIHKYTHRTLIPEFKRLTDFIMRHRKSAIAIFLLLFIPALYFQSKTEIYYDISRSLPYDLQANVGIRKLKEDFDMETTHMIVMRDDLPSYRMRELLSELEEIEGIKSVAGYQKFVGPTIPESFVPDQLVSAFKSNGKQMIMMSSKYATATLEVDEQLDEINDIVKKYDKDALLTGEAALTKDLEKTINKDIKVTNLISILAIFLIVGLIFKSFSVPIILVACIELAIFINLGLPYVMGDTIPFVTPIVIGAIQLGATVDYAILMSTRFQEEIRAGKEKKEAVEIATKTSAHSIVTSVLVFFAANTGVVMLSSIDIIKGICSILARGAVISGVVILFILPPILYVCEGLIAKTSKAWR